MIFGMFGILLIFYLKKRKGKQEQLVNTGEGLGDAVVSRAE